MTDTPYETIQSGIAVLAEDEPTWDDGPFPVRGVALPEDIVTNGDNTENVATYWSPDVVQDAAPLFEGTKIVDGSEHSAEEVMENPQPSPKTIVGEIMNVHYRDGVGVLYEGEVDDPEIAKQIDRGRVEVSPSLFRSLDGQHEEFDARIAEDVKAVRDLSIVADGAAAGNSIEPAPVAMEALSAEALSAAFDAGGTEGTDGSDDAEAKTDGATNGDDGTSGESSQSTGGQESTTKQTVNETMSEDELSETERELLAAADDVEGAIDVLQEHQSCEEPRIVEEYEHQAKQERVELLEELMDERLVAEKDLREATVETMSFEAKASEFENEDGEFEPETLVQTPETGDPEDEDLEDGEIEALLDDLDVADRDEAVDMLESHYEQYANAGWETNAQQAKERLKTLGVEV